MGKAPDTAASAPLRLAVLLSGGGRTLQNFAERIDAGALHAAISVVVSSRPEAYGLVRARDLGIRAHVVSRGACPDPGALADQVFDHIRAAGAQLVCLAGWLNLLPIPDDFVNRVLNVHPALLPSFGGPGMYGHHVHEAVLAAGCKVSGATVHFADQTYDTGPILAQRCCPVRPTDTPGTLAARVFRQECRAYPEAVALIAAGRVRVEGRVARILPERGA